MLQSDPERGLDNEQRQALLGLLAELDQVRTKLDAPPGPPRISPQRLERLVELGESLLARCQRSGGGERAPTRTR